MDETPYVETLEPGGSGGSPDGAGGSKLPPVLANLMGSMGAGKSPQGPGGGGINVQEILTSIMVRDTPHILFSLVGFQFCERGSLCSPGWPGTSCTLCLAYPSSCLAFTC
jgi:hypothetical protein